MNFVQYITVILLSLEPSYSDKETWLERSARMETIAQAIDDASSRATCSDKYDVLDCKKSWPKDKRSLGLLLVTTGFWESRFAKNVHEGKCRTYECDSFRTADGRIRHRARSPWQIQKTVFVTKDEYSKMNDSSIESTTMSANVAIRHLSHGVKTCSTFVGAMAFYGGAKNCLWSEARKRIAFYSTLDQKSNEQLKSEADNRKMKLEARFLNVKKEK
jgi:hypothetical protein